MSDPTKTEARSEVDKLRQLIDDLGSEVERQRQNGGSMRTNEVLAFNDRMFRLLAPAKATLESLALRLQLQERERRQLRALQDVGAVINSSLDPSEVLNNVMDTIIQLTGAERGFLMLQDAASGELDVEVARNIQRETIEESGFKISRSIVTRVAETGVPVVTTNAQDDPRFSTQASIISYNLRSILCVPLKIKESTIGVIYADNRVVSGIFSDTDLDLLTAFANQAAVAIENARLFEQIREQLADITEMKNLQDDVFESIASGVITIDLADRISLYNRAAERILGVPSEHVIEKNYLDALRPIGSIIEQVVEQIKRTGEYRSVEVDARVDERSQTITLNLTLSPIRDEKHDTLGVALVMNDISETKRLESVRRYLPAALVDQVRDLDAAQKPQRRNMTVFFADVRGFSTKSEDLDPELMIEIINGYFTVAVDAINRHEGLIDKYDGDALMALFNTSLNPQENHTERAVRAALVMRDELSAYHQTVPDEQRLFFGIGIHTGVAVVGNLGSPLRKDYSAIGDAVNLAERLQEMAEPNQILLSHDAYTSVSDWVDVRKLNPVHVRGRQAEEQIYALERLK